jgi:phospho-N-acetylmuramoyl-pentapeptide-transferase
MIQSLTLLKIFLPSVLAFIIGIAMTPLLTKYFYKYRLWKGASRLDNDVAMSEAFKQIHNEKIETGTPRVGGVIIWLSVLIVVFGMFVLSKMTNDPVFSRLDFLSRGQTLLPLAALLFGGVFGLFEDFLEIFVNRFKLFRQGLSSKYLVTIVAIIGLLASLWFYIKLGVDSVYVPFVGNISLGWLFIPFFVVVVLGTFSSRVIDGIDGLAGGVMAIAFGSYGIIAYLQNFFDIAALCFVITGAILAFLWFNIPPARFYMGETGMLGLTLALAIIAFMTNSVLLLLIIGILLVATSFSSAVQIFSKKYFGKKIFKIAPLHHHFQALGWSREKITMRYWIISIMAAALGVIISIVG